jgi:hypothetical protein
VLHELNVAICALREKHGQEPIDDPLPGEPDNAFRIIKNLFRVSALAECRSPATAVTPGK